MYSLTALPICIILKAYGGNMPASRYITIANTLEKRVLEDPYDPLPSIAKLAKEYGAAYQTIWKAVHFLSKKGVLKVRMGARTMPSSAEKDLKA